jgi:hypothetical protein
MAQNAEKWRETLKMKNGRKLLKIEEKAGAHEFKTICRSKKEATPGFPLNRLKVTGSLGIFQEEQEKVDLFLDGALIEKKPSGLGWQK